MSRKSRQRENQPRVVIDGEVARQIRQHARSCSKTEVCGVLIGNDATGGLTIEACIAGQNAAQAGTHVTFTQDTWEHIYKTKDSKYPESRIVGWYHSHPGFGVFLSDHDTFIHKNFFSSPLQVAWVYDPLSDEEGCFGWVGSRLERLSQISIMDEKGGEGAGETGKPEPVGAANPEEVDEQSESSNNSERDAAPPWVRITFTVMTYVVVLMIGFLVAELLFPRVLFMPVDIITGQPLLDRPVDGTTLDRILAEVQAKLKAKTLEPPNAGSGVAGKSEGTQPTQKPNAPPRQGDGDKHGPR